MLSIYKRESGKVGGVLSKTKEIEMGKESFVGSRVVCDYCCQSVA